MTKRIFKIYSLPFEYVEKIKTAASKYNIVIDTRPSDQGGRVEVLADYFISETPGALEVVLRTTRKRLYTLADGWRVYIPKSIAIEKPARAWDSPPKTPAACDMWAEVFRQQYKKDHERR